MFLQDLKQPNIYEGKGNEGGGRGRECEQAPRVQEHPPRGKLNLCMSEFVFPAVFGVVQV